MIFLIFPIEEGGGKKKIPSKYLSACFLGVKCDCTDNSWRFFLKNKTMLELGEIVGRKDDDLKKSW